MATPKTLTPIQTYYYQNYPIRVITRGGTSWWVAADIAAAMELFDTGSVTGKLPGNERSWEPIRTAAGLKQFAIVSRAAVNRCIQRSRYQEKMTPFAEWLEQTFPAAAMTSAPVHPPSPSPAEPAPALEAEIVEKPEPEEDSPLGVEGLQLYNYHGQHIRTVIRDGEPWFIAKDVCMALELGNPGQAAFSLRQDERRIISNDMDQGTRAILIISESGLYGLINQSRKPGAADFRRWVRKEILPSIRSARTYALPGVTPPQSTSTLEVLAALTQEMVRAERATNQRLHAVESARLALTRHRHWRIP